MNSIYLQNSTKEPPTHLLHHRYYHYRQNRCCTSQGLILWQLDGEFHYEGQKIYFRHCPCEYDGNVHARWPSDCQGYVSKVFLTRKTKSETELLSTRNSSVFNTLSACVGSWTKGVRHFYVPVVLYVQYAMWTMMFRYSFDTGTYYTYKYTT